MVTIILHCLHCGSEALVCNGHAPNGKQKCTKKSNSDELSIAALRKARVDS